MVFRTTGSLSAGPARAAIILMSAGLLLAGCQPKAPEPPPPEVKTEVPAAPAPVEAPIVPLTPPVLTRGDLVSAAGQEASAFAEGKVPAAGDPLAGRSFAVRIPFGCTGAAPVEGGERAGLAGWSWGPERKTIDISIAPADWSGSAMFAGPAAAAAWEAVEGFWIPRPWLASETCPAIRGDPLERQGPPVSAQTVGLAAVFDKGGSRVGRRNGRPYVFTVRSEEGVVLAPPENGYRLLLEGRIGSFPGGRAFACRAAGPDHRPVCIAPVQLDRVAFEDADGRMLSEWRTG